MAQVDRSPVWRLITAVLRNLPWWVLATGLVACTPDPPASQPQQATEAGFEVRAPEVFETDIRKSEAAASQMGQTGRAICKALKTRDRETLTSLLTADFQGTPVRGADAPTTVSFAQITQRLAVAPVSGDAFADALLKMTEPFAALERCQLITNAVRLYPSGDRAWMKYRVRLSGRTAQSARLLRGDLFTDQRRTGSTWRLQRAQFGPLEQVDSGEEVFTEVTAQVGAQLHLSEESRRALAAQLTRFELETIGGLGVIDWNADGRDDLFAWHAARGMVLFINDGHGGFTQRTGLIPGDDVGYQMVFVDLDNDGADELLTTRPRRCTDGVAVLPVFSREGDTLVERDGLKFNTDCARFSDLYFEHISVQDVDADGDVDLFFAGYAGLIPNGVDFNHFQSDEGAPNLLFINNGGLAFSEEARSRGLTPTRFSYTATFFDFEGDGDPDLYVANDFHHNELHLNDGKGHFTPGPQGPLTDNGQSMGLTVADFDGDADLDVYVSNMYSNAGHRIVPLTKAKLKSDTFQTLFRLSEGNTLYLQEGPGQYKEAGWASGVADAEWAWGQALIDVENDGKTDLYVANGMASSKEKPDADFCTHFWRKLVANAESIETQAAPNAYYHPDDVKAMQSFRGSYSGYERNRLFSNTGGGQYVELGHAAGVDFDSDGRATAAFDMDGDGRQDLAVLSIQRLQVLRNTLDAPGAWIRLTFEATKTHAHAIGAVVTVRAGQKKWVDRIRLTAGFHTQMKRELHFGLGQSARVDEVTIEWPSGEAQTWKDLDVRTRYHLTEGQAEPRKVDLKVWPKNTLPNPEPAYALDALAEPIGGGPEQALGTPGAPTVVTFWRPNCASCDEQVRALAPLKDVRRVVVIPEGAQGDRALLPAARWVHNNLELQRRFFGANSASAKRRPATFVFDAEAQLSRAYFRAVDSKALEARLGVLAPNPIVEDHLQLARTALEKKDLLALDHRLTAATETCKTAQTCLAVSKICMQARRMDLAEKVLLKATQKDPSAAAPWIQLGSLYGVTKRFEKSRAALHQAVQVAPEDVNALNAFGALLIDTKDRDGALAAIQSVLRLEPNNQRALKNLQMAEALPVTP